MSELLTFILSGALKDNMNVSGVIRYFKHRSFGSLFFVLSILCLLPGISIVAGFVLIFPALQLMLGYRMPVLPSVLEKRPLNVQRLHFICEKLIPLVAFTEQFAKPRIKLVSAEILMRLVGLLIVLLAIIIAIPFPLSNYPPAFAILILSIGLLEEDGLLIILGVLCGVVSVIFGFTLFNAVFTTFYQAIIHLLEEIAK